jgi:hypothetical protein
VELLPDRIEMGRRRNRVRVTCANQQQAIAIFGDAVNFGANICPRAGRQLLGATRLRFPRVSPSHTESVGLAAARGSLAGSRAEWGAGVLRDPGLFSCPSDCPIRLSAWKETGMDWARRSRWQ